MLMGVDARLRCLRRVALVIDGRSSAGEIVDGENIAQTFPCASAVGTDVTPATALHRYPKA
jgi:hypothetical protein